jgi:hypothetical protein
LVRDVFFLFNINFQRIFSYVKFLKAELPQLEDLLFVGNPLEEKHTAEGDWRKQVAQKLKGLKKLDGN